jgi:nicotinate dehydrogenase subunit B
MAHSRGDFLKNCGAVVVSFSSGSLGPQFAHGQGPFGTHPSHIDPKNLDSWLAVGSDGVITAFTGKCDFGQGIFTAQSQLVAEELCVGIGRVKLIQCDTSVCPDQGTTSGSQSTPTNFNSESLALAAATAREALLNFAATRLGEPIEHLTVADGVITGNLGRQVRYKELIGNQRFNLRLNTAGCQGCQTHSLRSATCTIGELRLGPSHRVKRDVEGTTRYVSPASIAGR